jgi:CspA family cold shock protein
MEKGVELGWFMVDRKESSLYMKIMLSLPINYQISITNTMKEGTVKFFNEAKGFGFVKETSTGQEYFVHVTGLVDKVRENDTITFDLKEGKKGLNAVEVRLAN